MAYLGGHSKDAVNFVKIPDVPYPGFDPVFLLYRYVVTLFAIEVD